MTIKKIQRRRPFRDSKIKKYWVFSSEFRSMHRKEREIKAANIASGNKRCWWIYEWMMAYPNRILKRSRSFYEN